MFIDIHLYAVSFIIIIAISPTRNVKALGLHSKDCKKL